VGGGGAARSETLTMATNSMVDFLDEQRREALGPVNKWFCSQHLGYEVTDPEVLLAYYIKHGGALHFRQMHRFDPDTLGEPNAKCA
jgi:hypothetical protein